MGQGSTRSTYSVIELGPDGAPVRSYNAVITPYYAGEGPGFPGDAPRPSHPIALPGDPWWGQDLKPTHPIALPGDPWWGQDLKPTHPIALPGDPWWPKPPEGGEPPAGHVVIMRPVPSDVTPPAAPSDKATVVQVIMEKGSPPAFAFLEPYVSTGPIDPPAAKK
jgi:hypothetical protein